MTLQQIADRQLLELAKENYELHRARFERSNDGVTLVELYAAVCEGRTSKHSIDYRALSAGVASAGGYLVAARTEKAQNPLPPTSIAYRAGAKVKLLPVPSVPPVIPVWDAIPAMEWLPTEVTPLSNQTPPLRGVNTSLKFGGAAVRISYQLDRQSNALESLRSLLRQMVTVGVDAVFLNGSGASGQPTGLLNTAGLASVSGATLGWTGITDLEEAVSLKDVSDDSLTYVAHPGVRKLLRRREVIAGGGVPIWDGNHVAGHPGITSTAMPSGTLVCGDFSNSTIVLLGGVNVFVNPYEPTGFKRGSVDLAVFVALDVVIDYPAAFGKSISIT